MAVSGVWYSACNQSVYIVYTQWLHPLLASPRILSVYFLLLMVHDYTTIYILLSYGNVLTACLH